MTQNQKPLPDKIITINDIKPNLSKYIPEDNAILFLSRQEYKDNEEQYIDMFQLYETEEKYLLAKEKEPNKNHFCVMAFWDEENKEILNNIDNKTKFTIFLPHGTQVELEKAEEVSKYLWENFKIKPNLCVLHWFGKEINWFNKENGNFSHYKIFFDDFGTGERIENINKIITTNSTGILPVQDNERLQVIDGKEIFEEYLKENN